MRSAAPERAEHGDLLKRLARAAQPRQPHRPSARPPRRAAAPPLKTARAFRWMLKFDHVYELPADEAEHYLRTWCRGAKRSRLRPIIDFARIVQNRSGSSRWFEYPHHQRTARRPQQPRAGQTPRPRLPLHTQLHRDDLPHRRQARHHHPREMAEPQIPVAPGASVVSHRSGSATCLETVALLLASCEAH